MTKESAKVEPQPLGIEDYATGVKGTFCISRPCDNPAFTEYWNPSGWAGSGYVFNDREIAEAVRVGLSIPVSKRVTGRTIPDLTKREHVCEYQSSVRASVSQGVAAEQEKK